MLVVKRVFSILLTFCHNLISAIKQIVEMRCFRAKIVSIAYFNLL